MARNKYTEINVVKIESEKEELEQEIEWSNTIKEVFTHHSQIDMYRYGTIPRRYWIEFYSLVGSSSLCRKFNLCTIFSLAEKGLFCAEDLEEQVGYPTAEKCLKVLFFGNYSMFLDEAHLWRLSGAIDLAHLDLYVWLAHLFGTLPCFYCIFTVVIWKIYLYKGHKILACCIAKHKVQKMDS
ncbi:hypothetical protein ACJX0J_020361 [Zea mays]